MPIIQANETTNYSQKGGTLKRKHFRYSITVPNSMMTFMGWKKGDELEFKLVNGQVILKMGERDSGKKGLKRIKY